MTRRHNGEGSIYAVKDKNGRITGYRGYVWCTKPDGLRYRKYVKAKTYEATQKAWLKLRDQASRGPVASDVPTVAAFLQYWLDEVVRPNLAPKTCEKYELFSRLHIIPHLGATRLDRLQVKDIRQWLNKLSRICQCCAQGKDAARPEEKRRCCAVGKCCHDILSAESRKDARNVLRAALTCAVEEQLIASNHAAVIRISARREPKRKRRSWTVDEARRFLESARRDDDVLYAAYILILVLGLRKGELLGLTWELVDLDSPELYVGGQLQRVGRQLLRRETKTGDQRPRCRCPICASPRSSSASNGRKPTGTEPGRHGGIPVSYSLPAMAPRSSRATSTAASTAASPRQACPRSPCTAHGRRADHCWQHSTCTHGWPCRSCGTARSR
jgi:Phage integrase, N-terminal SAM-like domain